jgi:hypothetical protein
VFGAARPSPISKGTHLPHAAIRYNNKRHLALSDARPASRPSSVECSIETLGTVTFGNLTSRFSKEALYQFALYCAQDSGICLVR